ncbi:MAG TPA: ABC transporter substrate-binding protein [Methylomirabilota bacterium]|jgi:NitT/TauT family transport system substrate-binding protein
MGRAVLVVEPFRSPFYAPQFVALAQGHFTDEGLDVTVRTAPRSGGTVDALLHGEAQICLGGIMRSLELADRGGPFLPHVIEVNSRNGFFLLARRPPPRFAWTDLVGKTVLSFAEAPTPWQCMLTVLRRAGVDPAAVTIERERPVAEAVAAFCAGHGDYLEQGQPVVERLVAEGVAHVVVSMGDATGPVPFSSYMTTPDFLRRHTDVVRAFTRAIHRTQRWIVEHDAAAMAAAIAPAFPDTEHEILVRVVDRYRRQNTWAHDPIIRRDGYEYLQQILLDGGFIERRHRYEDLVEVTIADAVVREAPLTAT